MDISGGARPGPPRTRERMRARLPAVFVAAFLATCAQLSGAEEARNVVLMIGDGMGFEHVRAAGLYLHGIEGALAMECLPCRASVGTRPASGDVTDSAAAATALATGHKVKNGVLSLAIPGDGSRLETLVEIFKRCGAPAGLVTTTRVIDATPAAFGAHAASRKEWGSIARSMFGEVRPDLVLGGAEEEPELRLARESGYRVIESLAELGRGGPVLGRFAAGSLPWEEGQSSQTLAEMTAAALAFLGTSTRGFFLMVEGARIDHASHSNDLARAIGEVVALDRAVETALRWAGARRDTLLVVTADHETGGLAVLRSRGRGNLPEVRWSTGHHTAADVPLFAWGAGEGHFAGRMENTEVFEAILRASPATRALVPAGAR